MRGSSGLRRVVALAGCVAVSAWGQVKAPVYEVVSVKPNKSGSDMRRIMFSPDRFSATGATLKGLLLVAYDLKMEEQVSGLTGPLAEARFDIEGKMDEETMAALKKLPLEEAMKTRRIMLRAALEDRFQLKAHSESKDLPIFELVVAKGGFKLKEADPNNTYPNGVKGPDGVPHAGMMMIRNGSMTAQGVTISSLTPMLGQQVNRIVVDKTGLTGKYDISLQWTRDDDPGGDPKDTGKTDNAPPSIFVALQEQLGLKLDAAKAPVEMIVVDHVEAPSDN